MTLAAAVSPWPTLAPSFFLLYCEPLALFLWTPCLLFSQLPSDFAGFRAVSRLLLLMSGDAELRSEPRYICDVCGGRVTWRHLSFKSSTCSIGSAAAALVLGGQETTFRASNAADVSHWQPLHLHPRRSSHLRYLWPWSHLPCSPVSAHSILLIELWSWQCTIFSYCAL